MNDADFAYLAGVLDGRGNIAVRRVGDTLLPLVAVSVKETDLLEWLNKVTDVKIVMTTRDFVKNGCTQHCLQQHVHVQSVSARWSVTGAKATIVLAAVRPFLRVKGIDADIALSVGLRAPHKPATPRKMASLGWPLPEWDTP